MPSLDMNWPTRADLPTPRLPRTATLYEVISFGGEDLGLTSSGSPSAGASELDLERFFRNESPRFITPVNRTKQLFSVLILVETSRYVRTRGHIYEGEPLAMKALTRVPHSGFIRKL